MSLRSPIRTVVGLGAAKEGPAHWWSQRMSAVALVVLGLWFVVSLLRFEAFDHEIVTAWLKAPVNTVLLALLVVVMVRHSMLGVQVVIEDYVGGGRRVATLVLVNFLHYVLGALGVFSVLRIAFGGAA